MSLMGTKNGRKQHTAELKAKVVIAAIREQHTTSELASMYGVHATQIGIWKKKALEELVQLFTSRRSSAVREQEDLTSTLYQQIGQLKVNPMIRKDAGNGIKRFYRSGVNDQPLDRRHNRSSRLGTS